MISCLLTTDPQQSYLTEWTVWPKRRPDPFLLIAT